MNKKKIGLFVIIVLIVVGAIYFFYENINKKTNLGNTITKSQEQLEEYILNINSYEAEVEVTVNSNKNTNRYVLKQQYCQPDLFSQEVVEPENIAGVKTILEGGKLRIENSQLTLTEMYENYQYINENSLCLYDFIQDYKQDAESKFSKTEQGIVLEAKARQENPYIQYKQLYIEEKTGLPKTLEVQDNNQNTLVYILYKEIKINSINQESMIAFQLTGLKNIQ